MWGEQMLKIFGVLGAVIRTNVTKLNVKTQLGLYISDGFEQRVRNSHGLSPYLDVALGVPRQFGCHCCSWLTRRCFSLAFSHAMVIAAPLSHSSSLRSTRSHPLAEIEPFTGQHAVAVEIDQHELAVVVDNS
jgi:hypothetical protein